MALSNIDRDLLQRCLGRKPRAWEDFIDRFMGLVIHVVNHSAESRSMRLTPEDREDLVAQVFLAIINDNLAILRNFRGESSLATYLTVVARRVVVHELLKQKSPAKLSNAQVSATQVDDGRGAEHGMANGHADADGREFEQRLSDREQVARLLEELDGAEAEVVRMYHLEGKSYQEISQSIGMSENSIGPTLSRARRKMRQGADPAKS